MKTTITTFNDQASFPQQALVVIFDLEGFSKFFSQPDVQNYVPKFLNLVLEAVELSFNGGEMHYALFINGKVPKPNPLPQPIHSKFLGDGALYIWSMKDFDDKAVVALINRLWTLRTNFKKVLDKATDIVPIMEIPQSIRFGVAAGSVYKLNCVGSTKEEFIGYSINLASRLQSYCREIGFIVSGRTNIKVSEIKKHSYKKVVATKIKGFPQEVVLVDETDFEKISEEVRNDIFEAR